AHPPGAWRRRPRFLNWWPLRGRAGPESWCRNRASKPLVAHLTKQFGARLAPAGHAAAKLGEGLDGVLGLLDRRDAGNRLAATGDDHFLAGLDLVKQVAEMGFGFCQRNGAHAAPSWSSDWSHGSPTPLAGKSGDF